MLTISQPHGVQCGRCGGTFIAPEVEFPSAVCNRCRAIVDVEHDVLPNMDEGELLVWLPGAPKGHPAFFAFLAYFTEEGDDDE